MSVRVRVAPSPTGDPHVGLAYQALFNYALARRHGGQFILRIEDTDRARSDPRYEQVIMDALRWCGLQWDEGPDIGGPHEVYRQSDNPPGHYMNHAISLVAQGRAFFCFQTAEQTRKDKALLREEGGTRAYRSPDRDLDPDEARLRKRTEDYTIRLKVPEGTILVHDQLRKPTEIDLVGVDDQVLIKGKAEEQMPTYHLAVVVDDHAMGITHIIRGEEWIPSLPKHVLLYQALGWEMPPVYHMPTILNPDGKGKLSKRNQPVSILYYRDAGYLPEALLNFLGTLGYSPGQGDEKVSLEDFCASIDLDRVATGQPRWDPAKLKAFNERYLRESTPKQVYDHLENWLLNREYLGRAVEMTQPRLSTLADFAPLVAPLLGPDPALDLDTLLPEGMEASAACDLLWSYLQLLEDSSWFASAAKESAEYAAQSWGVRIRQLTHVLFVSLCGQPVGAPIYDVIELLGKDRCRVRLRAGIACLNGGSAPGKKALKKMDKRWAAARSSE